MKHSTLIRFLVIMALLAGWVYYIFPVKDKAFLPVRDSKTGAVVEPGVFLSLAKPKLDAYAKAGDTAKVKAFNDMLSRAEKQIADAKAGADGQGRRSLAPNVAVELACKRNRAEGRERLDLSDYIVMGGMSNWFYAHFPSFHEKFWGKPDSTNKMLLEYVRRQAAGHVRLGLDIRGGTEFVIGWDEADIMPDERGNRASADEVRREVLENLERRVNALGVAEPEIKPIGATSVSVRMPTVTEDDKQSIRDLLKTAGKLEFHIVHPENQRLVAEYMAKSADFTPPAGYTLVETEAQGKRDEGSLYFIKKHAEPVRGSDVTKAWATVGTYGGFEVQLAFNSAGAKAFGDVTGANVGNLMAIMLDGKVYSAPEIKDAIRGGNCQITGRFTLDEAQGLASILNGGRMPVQTRIDSEFGTDPTLGADSIKSGILAGIVGAIAVILFMLIYYHLSGAVAVFAMVANILFQVGTMAILGATFTLPGIAGIVLTIGMAVDANILIYERFREEQAAGKTVANSIQAGFSRAFWTIFDSHVTALIAGIILYWFGTGPVKGFAVALSIGVVANLFTSIVLSRSVYDVMLNYCPPKKLSMFHIFSKVPHIDFMGMRRVFFVVSGILTIAAIGLIAWRFQRGEALSTDFTGGATMTYKYDRSFTPPGVDAIRREAETAGIGRDLRIGYKTAGVTQEYLLEITIPQMLAEKMAREKGMVAKELAAAPGTKQAVAAEKAATKAMESLIAQMTDVLQAKFPQAKFEQKQTYHVGSTVGDQFKKYAVWSLLLSWIAIILYLAFRFEFAYGVAAVIALIHDVIVAAGVGALMDKQLSLTVLAALLTIVGYSVNDTIVVFDRIRESFSLQRKGSYEEVVNLSINQTLSRTLLTSVTVFFCVLSLYLLGGGAINDFALIMLTGVVVGTYSSVFVASAIVVAWHKYRPLTPVVPVVKKQEEDVVEEEA